MHVQCDCIYVQRFVWKEFWVSDKPTSQGCNKDNGSGEDVLQFLFHLCKHSMEWKILGNTDPGSALLCASLISFFFLMFQKFREKLPSYGMRKVNAYIFKSLLFILIFSSARLCMNIFQMENSIPPPRLASGGWGHCLLWGNISWRPWCLENLSGYFG